MKIRLDKFLNTKYKNYSRNKISNFIKGGKVQVDGNIVTKNNYLVKENENVILNVDEKQIWVSRGSYKLLKALKIFKINLNNKVCLDIGCSTGGFSQVMLKNNAKKIYAIDVGNKQFNKSLLCKKIILREKTHFCKTKTEDYEQIDFIACDVSFISATKIIEHVCKIFNFNFIFICLIKPQFELTKKILDKNKGYIPKKYHHIAINKIINCAIKLGLICSNVVESPITGAKSNNIEYLICLRRKKS